MAEPVSLWAVPGGRDVPFFRSARARRPLLGQLLVDSGQLSVTDRRQALDQQARVDARFGDILVARNLIDRPKLMAAIARQYGAELADLSESPPDMALASQLGLDACLELGLVPWRRSRECVDVATARPDEFERRRPFLERHLGPVRMAVAGELDLHRAIWSLQPAQLVRRAEARVAPSESCRALAISFARARPLVRLVIVAVAVIVVLYPTATLRGLTLWAIVTLLANSMLKAAALFLEALRPSRTDLEDAAPVVARLPRVSLLVPLYRERRMADQLVARLERLDYPRELLEICLIMEEDDDVTRRALEAQDLPSHMRCITVPRGRIKTKPRALNYALDFCRGSIIGVYDAEDAPDPDQVMRVVRRFHRRGANLACVQATLDFYNSRTNWMARCFAVEYAAWFRVVLPGIVRLGLVAPLGGTSLFFRRDVLERLGGWDAHNVTEDADLGVRLVRHGYRTEFIDSVTREEANCRVWPWIRQRSRWLKGYMMTWAVHMGRPGRLFRQLGPWRFAGFQLLFLGTISQFLLAPLLWLFWLTPFGLQHPFAPSLPPATLTALMAAFLLSEAISVAVGLFAVCKAGHRHLAPWVITLQLYFPLAALAAYKGLLELITRPFFWDKTEHGIYAPPAEDAALDPKASRPPQPARRRA